MTAGGPSGRGRMVLIVTVVAFALRFAHLWFMRANPLFDHPIMDAAAHDLRARGLLDGTWPGPEPFTSTPLYPYILGGLYWLFDASRFPVQLVHCLISALGAGLAALSAARLWGSRAGYMAGLLLAALWTSIHFSSELLVVTVSVTLNLLWLWLLLRDGETRVARRLAMVGIVIGLSAVARPNVLVVLPVVVWYAWQTLKPRTLAWLALLAALALPVIPVTVSNLVRGGDAILIASGGGVEFHAANNPDAYGRTAVASWTSPARPGGFEAAAAVAERIEGRDLTPSQVDGFHLRRGLSFWIEDPGRAASLYAHKIRMLFGAGERSHDKSIYSWREWSPLLRAPVLVGWPVLLFLAVLGWSRRDGFSGSRGLLIWVCLAYAVSVLLFFVSARYRLPLAAILAIPAGAGLDALVSAIRERHWPHGYLGIAVALGAVLFSISDFRDFRDNRVETDPIYPYTLGEAYRADGRTRQAIQAYNRALACQDRYPDSRFERVRAALYQALGETLLADDRPDEALRTAGRWVEADPTSTEARLAYGDRLLSADRVDEAAVQFDIVMRTTPDDPRAKLGSAWVLYHDREYGTALRRFETINRGGEDTRALCGAGLCLLALERHEESEKAFVRVLQLEPTDIRSQVGLAEIYQKTGRQDEAREVYRSILHNDPDDERARRWLAEHPVAGVSQAPGR